MSILSTFMLVGMGAIIAESDTLRQATGEPQPTAVDLRGTASGTYMEMRVRNELHPLKPSEKLDFYEWLSLLGDLGWWDNTGETHDQFLDRLAAWDEANPEEE